MAAFEPSPGTKGRDESVSFGAVKSPKIPQDFKQKTAFRGGILIIIIFILPKINS